MSRVVAGTLLLPNGQPMANASIYFTAKRTEAVSIIEGSNTFFTTNNAGVYNQTVVNGWYAVSIEYIADSSGAHTRRWPLGDVFIEDGASTTLEALIIASNAPDDLALGIFYEILEQAQSAAVSAQASANAASASAASVTPTTGPNDTTPGHLWRTNDLVKTTGQADVGAAVAARIPVAGWMGYGSAIFLMSSDDLLNLSALNNSGNAKYIWASASIPANSPVTSACYLTREYSSSSHEKLIAYVRDNGDIYVRTKSGTWGGWVQVWTGSNLIKTTSTSDTTVGSVLKTGDAGLLGFTTDIPASPGINSWTTGGLWRIRGDDAGGPSTSASQVIHMQRNTSIAAQICITDNGQFFSRATSSASLAAWNSHWTSSNLANPMTLDSAQTVTSSKTWTANQIFNGTVDMAPVAFTVSTVPAASAKTNRLIVVTNASTGRGLFVSDGANWRNSGTGAILS